MLFCPGRYSIFVAKFSYSLSYNVLANNVLVVDITSNDEREKTVFALLTKSFLIDNSVTLSD